MCRRGERIEIRQQHFSSGFLQFKTKSEICCRFWPRTGCSWLSPVYSRSSGSSQLRAPWLRTTIPGTTASVLSPTFRIMKLWQRQEKFVKTERQMRRSSGTCERKSEQCTVSEHFYFAGLDIYAGGSLLTLLGGHDTCVLGA